MNRTISTPRVPFTATLGLLLALAIALGAPLTASAAEAETNECLNLASCTSVPNTPWVAVPAAKTGFTESNQGIEQPGTTLWRVNCPGSTVPAGRDYSGRETTNESLIVTALIPPFNIGITGSGSANFFAYWQGLEPTSFKPFVGCIPAAQSSAARAAGAAGGHHVHLRTITRTLRPGQTKTFVHHCAKGEKLIGSEHGVAFFSDSPPSKGELSKVTVERTQRRGRIVVHAKTGAFVTDRVQLQIHAFCR